MDESTAATKIQALQRGRQSRAEVAQLKKQQQDAATKIQALHRGRLGRVAAARAKDETPIFTRPHTYSCDEFTVIKTRFDLVRAKDESYGWANFVADVQGELIDVYGSARSFGDPAGAASATAEAATTAAVGRGGSESWLSYSTTKNPETFANNLTEKVFVTLREFDVARKHALHLRAEHEAIEAARPPPPKVEPKFDENGDEIPPPPKSKKQLREEAELKKQDTARLKTLLEAEHAVACLELKVKNVAQLHSIRVNHYFGTA